MGVIISAEPVVAKRKIEKQDLVSVNLIALCPDNPIMRIDRPRVGFFEKGLGLAKH